MLYYIHTYLWHSFKKNFRFPLLFLMGKTNESKLFALTLIFPIDFLSFRSVFWSFAPCTIRQQPQVLVIHFMTLRLTRGCMWGWGGKTSTTTTRSCITIDPSNLKVMSLQNWWVSSWLVGGMTIFIIVVRHRCCSVKIHEFGKWNWTYIIRAGGQTVSNIFFENEIDFWGTYGPVVSCCSLVVCPRGLRSFA